MSTTGRRTCFHGDLDAIGVIQGLKRYWGSPQRHPENPQSVKGMSGPVYDATVFFDPSDGKWRMYHTTRLDQPIGACLDPMGMLFSDDGLSWAAPELDIIKSDAGTGFIYLSEGKSISGMGVLYDPDDPDPSRLWKLFYCTQMWRPDSGEKIDSDCRVAFSTDGIHWKPFEGNPVSHVMSDTRHCTFIDPHSGKYVIIMRMRRAPDGSLLYRHGDRISGDSVRCCGRIESDDFIHWTEPELIIAPSEWTSKGDQYYGLTVLPYEGEYLGFLRVFHRQAPNYGYLDEQLVISADCRNWRPAGDSMFLTGSEPGEWDCASAGISPRVIVREEDILFYYSGSARAHGGGNPTPAPGEQCGLATLRRDGFAYLQAPWEYGLLTSHPFESNAGDLHINCNASGGEVTVAVLDSTRAPLPGYSHEDCVKLTSDCLDTAVRWKTGSSLPADGEVSVQFRVGGGARFYSFWIAG